MKIFRRFIHISNNKIRVCKLGLLLQCPWVYKYFLPPLHILLTLIFFEDRIEMYLGSEVLTVVIMKSSIFWDIMTCGPLKVNWRFGGTCRLHLQGRRISRAWNEHEAGSSRTCLLLYLSVVLQPFAGPRLLFNFLILCTVGRTPWTGDQPVARSLPTQTSMPRVGFEPTIPVFSSWRRRFMPHTARPLWSALLPIVTQITANTGFTY
jgi:hypothetical protein